MTFRCVQFLLGIVYIQFSEEGGGVDSLAQAIQFNLEGSIEMKKKMFGTLAAMMMMTAVIMIPVSAAPDPNASTTAYIDWSVYYSNKVRGKAFAMTSNPIMTQINVAGSFLQGSTLKESGTGSTNSRNTEASWFTKDGVYADTNSYTLNAASRTYYAGGSYDQQYDSTTW